MYVWNRPCVQRVHSVASVPCHLQSDWVPFRSVVTSNCPANLPPARSLCMLICAQTCLVSLFIKPMLSSIRSMSVVFTAQIHFLTIFSHACILVQSLNDICPCVGSMHYAGPVNHSRINEQKGPWPHDGRHRKPSNTRKKGLLSELPCHKMLLYFIVIFLYSFCSVA